MLHSVLMLLVLQTVSAPSQPGQTPGVQPAPPPAPAPAAPDTLVLFGYVPQRVFDSDEKEFTDFETMLAEIAKADVVFVGEQHDDRNTHRLEVAILEGLMRRRGKLTVSLEMFERDAQQVLSDYMAGSITEEEFLQQSRPWPRYVSDYRPIVELARAHGWPVIAANVPRRLANQVSKGGLDVLNALPEADRSHIAQSIECPPDDYRKRFVATISAHPMPGMEKMSAEEAGAVYQRFYQAQCLKDETMAEAIAAASGPGHPLIVHYNGAFHSDYTLGTAARVKRRLKNARVAVVTVVPVDDLDTLKKPSKEERKVADYIVYTLRPRQSPHSKTQ